MALQQEIIQALGAKPTVDAHEEIRRSVDFFKIVLKKERVPEIPGAGHQRRPGLYPDR